MQSCMVEDDEAHLQDGTNLIASIPIVSRNFEINSINNDENDNQNGQGDSQITLTDDQCDMLYL